MKRYEYMVTSLRTKKVFATFLQYIKELLLGIQDIGQDIGYAYFC